MQPPFGVQIRPLARLPSTLSPIQLLPTELLLEVFLSSYPISTPRLIDTFDMKQPPWNLGKICSHWRRAVISSPQLWSCIGINLYDLESNDRKPRDVIAMLKTWLNRSGSLPLTFYFYDGVSLPTSQQILRVLMEESHRWSEVDLFMQPCLFLTLSRIRGRIPLLRTLEVTLGRAKLGSKRFLIDAFDVAPQLQNLVVDYGSHNTPIIILIPWDQISDYAGTPASNAGGPLGIIEQCPNLVGLHLEWKPPFFPLHHDPLANPRLIQHLCLRKLEIEDINYLARLQLPALEDITVSTINCREGLLLLSRLFTQSGCALKKLDLRDVLVATEEEVTNFLASIPALSDLTIAFATVNPEVVNAFILPMTFNVPDSPGIVSSDPQSLLPRMEKFHLIFEIAHPENPHLDYQYLVDMMESRWCQSTHRDKSLCHGKSIAGLCSVTLEAPRTADLGQLMRLQAMKSEGLGLRVELF